MRRCILVLMSLWMAGSIGSVRAQAPNIQPPEVSTKAPRLQAADAAYASGQVDQALDAYNRALAGSGNDKDAVMHAHRRLGVLHATLGQLEKARESFDRSLSIDPSQPVPKDLSPQHHPLYAAAKAASTGPIMLKLLTNAGDHSATHTKVRVQVEGGAANFVRNVSLICGGQTEVAAPMAAISIRNEVFTKGSADCSAYANDVYSNRIASTSQTISYVPTAKATAHASTDKAASDSAASTIPDGPPKKKRTGLWVGLSIAIVAVVGAAIAVTLWALNKPRTNVYMPQVVPEN